VRKDHNGSTYAQVTNLGTAPDFTRSRFALVADAVIQEMQSIAGDGGYFGTTSNHPFRIYTNRNTRVTVTENGDVGIGYANPTARLHVNGSLKVTGPISYGAPDFDLPDYVFEPDYKLMPIAKLAEYVAREKHLPNVPPADEIREKGINLGEFQMRLLEKIEELTLYAVRQAKNIEDKDAEIAALNGRLSALERIVQRLAGEKEGGGR
jgi:hypothetical protein